MAGTMDGRRACAIVLVLALASAGAITPLGSCDRCPPGCPMHGRTESRRLGCHHGNRAAPHGPGAAAANDRDGSQCAFGARCGRTPADATGALVTLPPDDGRIEPLLVAVAGPRDVTGGRLAPGPAPPVPPPRRAG